ncbi:hypothetical protein [Rubrivirga sp. IMCC43871]|uniref:hypothetical protein n=1 Tax=Rubrivirga sp. IMCC43871 TaxID=3391575 RepID=UPI00398FA0D7
MPESSSVGFQLTSAPGGRCTRSVDADFTDPTQAPRPRSEVPVGEGPALTWAVDAADPAALLAEGDHTLPA